MFTDLQNKKDRLHRGDIFQRYNGEPTMFGRLCGVILFGLLVTIYFLTQI